MIKKHNKLVRDNIIKIIENDNRKCSYEVITIKNIKIHLLNKLEEEVQKFHDEPSIEEMADVLEVIDALISTYGFNKEKLEEYKLLKKQEKGAFEKRIFLKEVW